MGGKVRSPRNEDTNYFYWIDFSSCVFLTKGLFGLFTMDSEWVKWSFMTRSTSKTWHCKGAGRFGFASLYFVDSRTLLLVVAAFSLRASERNINQECWQRGLLVGYSNWNNSWAVDKFQADWPSKIPEHENKWVYQCGFQSQPARLCQMLLPSLPSFFLIKKIKEF